MTCPDAPARLLVMGIVNLTPDSFSDGGRFCAPPAALEHARQLVADGADMIDVGAESTRPGFEAVPVDEQLRRLHDVLPGMRDIGVPFSIDTRSAAVAASAVAAGASIVNDVSGGAHDPAMLGVVAGLGVDFVCQLWGRDPHIPLRDQLAARLDACLDAGIARPRIVLDPGLGFGFDPQDDWPALARIDDAMGLGQRVLVGASRKRFLATPGDDASLRDDAAIAVTAWCAQHGVWAVRTHTVAPHRRVIDVISRLLECRGDSR